MKSMSQERSWLHWHELRNLHHGLASAQDEQIAKVVAVVDALESRGAADDVIAPLRPRLAQIRPPRPLRFSRLLFMPLDALIVPTPVWRKDAPTIPRAAVQPLANMVHDAMGADARTIDEAIQARTANDVEIVRYAGGMLWPRASAILTNLSTPPPTWGQSHLPSDSFAMLARRAATLLGQTERLNTLFAERDIGITHEAEAIAPVLAIAGMDDATTLAMMATLMLARLPAARRLLKQVANSLGLPDSLMSTAIEQAFTVLVDRLETRSGVETLVIGSRLDQAGTEVRCIIELLHGIYAQRQSDDWPSRLSAIFRRLEASCRLRFAVALEVEFTAALQAGGGALEDAARGVRDLQQQASRLGRGSSYDMLLRQAVEMATGADLSLIDRVRLVEILLGSDEALALLEAPPEPAIPAASSIGRVRGERKSSEIATAPRPTTSQPTRQS
jgi:hypothetical protein